MSKVILHIGTHKTATTTIQDTFWANAPRLAEHGLIYPRLGRDTVTGHHGLAFDWVSLPPVYKLDTPSLDAFARIAAEHADGEDTVFLSSEEFSRGDPRHTVDLAAVRDALAPFDRIEVLCALRPQWQFLQSIYLELSKSRSPMRPPQLVDPVIESGMFEGLWIDYNRLLDRLEVVFDPDEITFLDFETCRKAPGGILGTVLDHLGLDIDPDTLEKVNGGTSNVSPMVLASWAANILAEPARAPQWLVDRSEATFREEFGPDMRPCLFTREEFNALGAHFDGLNEAFEQRRQDVQPGFRLTRADIGPLNVFRNTIPGNLWFRFCRTTIRARL